MSLFSSLKSYVPRGARYKTKALLEYATSLRTVQRDLDRFILIGTHHKTGTVWMRGIFSQLALLYGYTFRNYTRGLESSYEFSLLFDTHSQFDLTAFDQVPYRGMHLIRDPRDLIVSGCYYHQKSTETWLHVPHQKYNGMTYQEKINSFPSMHDRLLFEMEEGAAGAIRDMSQWNYRNPAFIEVKYEDLIADYDLTLFHQIFSFIGVEGKMIPKALELAWKNSLFSNRLAPNFHRRSGKASQWTQYFESSHKQRFLELFGDVLVRLGYEEDNTWVELSRTCEEVAIDGIEQPHTTDILRH